VSGELGKDGGRQARDPESDSETPVMKQVTIRRYILELTYRR
jgi:hypothetical protein